MVATVKFINSSSFNDEEVWIQFVSGSVAGTGNSGAITLTQSVFSNPDAYSLKQLNQQMNLTRMSGRMYLNFVERPLLPPRADSAQRIRTLSDPTLRKRFNTFEAHILKHGPTSDARRCLAERSSSLFRFSNVTIAAGGEDVILAAQIRV